MLLRVSNCDTGTGCMSLGDEDTERGASGAAGLPLRRNAKLFLLTYSFTAATGMRSSLPMRTSGSSPFRRSVRSVYWPMPSLRDTWRRVSKIGCVSVT